MTKLRTLSLAAMLAASLAGAATRANAGPSIIRDETLRDVATTPVLGRGYSVATNTFQSICMKEIVTTKPSYDFKYTFEQIDAEAAENIKKSGSFEAAYGANYGFFKVRGTMKGDFKSDITTTQKSTNILVTIEVDSYYASMDETKGALADPAVQLATRDLPGFFDACGMYYVRSINRKSTIKSLFSFNAQSEAEDSHFAAQLEAEIKGWGWSGSMKSSMSQDTKRSSENRQLKITTNASGLGKIAGTTLLAYDLESFRKAVLSAFTATQDDDVGKVTSIEIVPWVEHLQFQSLMLANANYSTDGKRNMQVNSEFLSEVDRAARAKLNVFYKGKQCRGKIEADHRNYDTQGVSTWINDDGVSLGKYTTKNFKDGSVRTMEQLWSALTPEKQQLMFNEYDAFMYGGKDDLPIVIQNGRRTYRNDVDSSPLIAPTGPNRVDWAASARTAIETKYPAPETWLVAYARGYLRANGQAGALFDKQTLAEMIAPLLADNGIDLRTPFTETIVYLEGSDRKTHDITIKNKTELESGVWRLAFNNPGALIESKDGWFGFAAAGILDNDDFAKLFVPVIRDEVKARTEIPLEPGVTDLKILATAYAEKVELETKDSPRAYPSFAAIAQGAVARLMQGGTDRTSESNVDPMVTAYLLKQLKTYDMEFFKREASRLGLYDENENNGVFSDAKQWEAASKLYQQYKLIASQGGATSLGVVGFFGSAEYVGAARCVRDLLRDNRFLKDSYRNIESCRRVETQLGTIRSEVVENFCLPNPERPTLPGTQP